jgi:tetraacyldisaccharide 4'-kinase
VKEIEPADLIVLDDAFQFRALKATLNILLVDYNRPVQKDSLLPFGRLRDLPERLGEADILIVTKCPAYLQDEERIQWAEELHLKDYDLATCKGKDRKGREKLLLFSAIRYDGMLPVFPEEADRRYAYAQKLVLFSGIAKDTPLRRYLSDKYRIVKHFSFADHHKYTASDIRKISRATAEHPTAVVTTTEKDSQRIERLSCIPADLRTKLFQVPIQVGFLTEEEHALFEQALFNAIRRA